MLATIGYERSTLADFIASLRLSGISVIVDIRERAQSRRPGFSKTVLREALAAVGIDYVHLRELGDPATGRAAARSGQRELFISIFGQVMKTPRASEALEFIEQLTTSGNVCLMCYERDHNDCHRKIVSDALEHRLDIKARHLGVKEGAASEGIKRRVFHPNQGSTASV